MIAAQNYEQFSTSSIYLSSPIKNTILDNGYFTRFIQSSDCCMFNSISIVVNLTSVIFEQYFNKKKCVFDYNKNINEITNLMQIEKDLLKMFSNKNKIPIYTLQSQLNKSYIKKCYTNKEHTVLKNSYESIRFIFKVSGIWEDKEKYGLTFRFIVVNE